MPEINQALHGYSGGHRLLAASTALSKNAEYAMVVTSDLSGPSHSQLDNGYLTGYALSADGLYVLARTWAAPEVSRPGCVWTHSLIFEAVQLASMNNLDSLLSVFRRPNGTDFDHYSRPAQVSDNVVQQRGRVEALLPLVTALYSQTQPVIFPAAPTETLERSIIAIWQHQWPKLRRSFCFCTGALANRREVTGIPFDLQLVPPDRLRRIERSIPDAIVGSEIEPESNSAYNELEFLANDIASAPASDLRQFLTMFGADVAGGRSAYLPLVQIFLSTRGGRIRDADLALQRLGSGEAQRLRHSVFGAEPPDLEFTEYDRLEFLSIAPEVEGTGVTASAAGERAAQLFRKQSPLPLVQSLLRASLTEIGESVLQRASECVTIADLEKLEEAIPGSVVTFLRANPALAELPALWGTFDEHQDEFVDVLCSMKDTISSGTVQAILAGLDAGSVPRNFIDRIGRSAVRALFDAAEAPLTVTPATWIRSLESRSADVANWLEDASTCSPWQLLLAAQVDPLSLHSVSRATWDQCLPKSLPEAMEPKERKKIAAWLAAIGFAAEGSPELLVLTFSALHSAASKRGLRYEDWQRLSDVLPEGNPWKDWDRCERLRRGLSSAWVRADWPPQRFLVAAGNHLESVLKSSRKVPHAREFLSRLAPAAAKLGMKLTKAEKKALEKASRN